MMIPYTFRVVRYVHDPALGERLNVGVLLYAPDGNFFGAKFESLYSRLSGAFLNFEGENYRRHLNRLESAFRRVSEEALPHLELFDAPRNLETLTRQVIIDTGGSFEPGVLLTGITDDPAAELEIIFDRMVASQYRRETKTHRTDEDVWAVYQRRLPAEVRRLLKEKTFETREYDETFPHTFKNGLWHILEPVTMDYADPGSMQNKAVDWLGRSLALRDHPDLGKLYLLLGAPQKEGFGGRYSRVKDLLHKIPVEHEIIEEDEAADFAEHIADYMRKQGLITEKEAD